VQTLITHEFVRKKTAPANTIPNKGECVIVLCLTPILNITIIAETNTIPPKISLKKNQDVIANAIDIPNIKLLIFDFVSKSGANETTKQKAMHNIAL